MKQNITVVSLGPGDPELLTAQSLNTMKKAKRLIFRTAQHPVAEANPLHTPIHTETDTHHTSS